MSLFPPHPDALDEKELRRVTNILLEAQENAEPLTDWECDFVADMLERVEQYGRGTRISEKQMEIIDRIDDKLNG